MNRSSFLILVSIVCVAITLVVGISFWNVILEHSMDMPIYDDVRERIDIILSDRIPIGCFIPPDSNAEAVYTGVFNDNDLRNAYLEIGDNIYIDPGFWNTFIKDNLKNGIKLNGYCNDSDRKGCLCMKDDFPGWGEDGMFQMKRSLDFGTEYEPVRAIGEDLDKQEFAGLKNQPSVFVVMPGEEPKLSVYGGVKLRGNRTVEKVTAALYKGTISEDANRISEIGGIERSCYWGAKWTKYQSCRAVNPKIDCRMNCDCYTDEKYYNEDTLTICENYCSSRDFEGVSSECGIGCGIGEERDCYKKCYVRTGDAEDCSIECSCADCVAIEEYDLINNFCEDLLGDVKKGCENFIYFEKSVFQLNSSEYTNFKIGDLEWTGGNYRGPVWVVSTITTREQHPGDSCYNPNHFNCYYNCWEGVCEEAKSCNSINADCLLLSGIKLLCNFQDETLSVKNLALSSASGQEIWNYGIRARKKCENSCECSATTQRETENTFILCRNFCISRDGFYKDTEKANRCVNGCEWASRIYDKPEYVEFGKNVDLVFVIDTSGSMCQGGSNEWSGLCNIINDIVAEVEKEDYKVKITIYGLGKKTCNKINYCADEEIPVSSESWGNGAVWAIKNHQWNDNSLSKVLFVVGDEGPSGGDPWETTADRESVKYAVEVANANKVTIFGLWGKSGDEDIESGLKQLFRDISEPTKGTASFFDTGDTSSLVTLITGAIRKDEEFELGWDTYTNLLKNALPADIPYMWRDVYEEVFSNLVYLIDWRGDTSSWNSWSYPCGGDWNKICSSEINYNKSFELNSMLEEIKELY
ncbi:MAG: hypothetical protein DRP06_01295 [Candidatus Aenigmatarchaeota archaeon]|nr:MAG: hypothetical protein DRP06_01295 [Candidatus Aenigmarchaeota archaeon]